jgi:hypothetical protein
MRFKKIVIIISLVSIFSCAAADKAEVRNDINLIVPGKSAEGFNLGQEIHKKDYKVYESRETNIADILEADNFADIKFDSLSRSGNSSILFLEKGIITAIAGLTIERRTTSDGVLLSRGIGNFILNYGNSGLSIVKRKNHSIYIYKESGIAVFDDNNDKTIDMYLIFR